MAQQARHPDEVHTVDLEVPATMSSRQRLEWEVAQLADGTLTPDRRSAVEAALVTDAELRETYWSHRRVGELLCDSNTLRLDTGALEGRIIAAVASEPEYGRPLRVERTAPQRGAPIADVLRGWWFTISAAAAALVIGVGLGVVMFGGEREPVVQVAVGGPGGGANSGVEPQIEVVGPINIAQQSVQDGEVVALTVTGPDFHAIMDPQVETPVPDYAYSYGTSAVIDTPRQMVIASLSETE